MVLRLSGKGAWVRRQMAVKELSRRGTSKSRLPSGHVECFFFWRWDLMSKDGSDYHTVTAAFPVRVWRAGSSVGRGVFQLPGEDPGQVCVCPTTIAS